MATDVRDGGGDGGRGGGAEKGWAGRGVARERVEEGRWGGGEGEREADSGAYTD